MNQYELNYVHKFYPNWKPVSPYQLHAVFCKLKEKYGRKITGQTTMRLPLKPKEPKYEQLSLFDMMEV